MGGRKKNTKAIINNFSLLSGLSKSYETLGFFFVEFINVRIGKGYIGSSDDIFIYAYSCPAIFAIAAGYQNSGECTSAFVLIQNPHFIVLQINRADTGKKIAEGFS